MSSIIMNGDAFIKKGYLISTDKQLLDFETIYHFLDQQSYWAKGIPKDKLRRALENSMCFGVYYGKKQIGLGRVVTDEATFAYLADVFILQAHRGIGLSKWLVQTILEHPDLQGLRRWLLATADAQGLYGQFGFVPVNNPERWMQIYTPYQVNDN